MQEKEKVYGVLLHYQRHLHREPRNSRFCGGLCTSGKAWRAKTKFQKRQGEKKVDKNPRNLFDFVFMLVCAVRRRALRFLSMASATGEPPAKRQRFERNLPAFAPASRDSIFMFPVQQNPVRTSIVGAVPAHGC